MSKILEYKDFIGSVECSLEDNLLYGKILYINGLITYEARTLDELKEEFHLAVDDYIQFCQEQGLDAYKSFNGKFNVRISPDLHKKASLLATKQDLSLNAFVSKAIQNEILSDEREVSIAYQFMKTTIATTIKQGSRNLEVDISLSQYKKDIEYQFQRTTVN